MATKKNTPKIEIAPKKPKAPTPDPITTQSTSDRPMPTNMMLRYTPDEIAKRRYDLMLAEMQRRAQLGQFSPIKEQGGYIGAQEINPDLIKRARDEYSASLPQNARYFDVMTPTKYGGMFGSSAGSGFDAWFEKNYINNPNSPLNDQERLVLQRQIPITQANTQQFQPGYQEAMAQQTYNNLMQQQMANASIPNPRYGIDFIEGGPRYQPMMPAPGQVAQQPVPTQQIPSNQQAMQNYQNLLAQGLSQFQAQTYPGQSQFGGIGKLAQTQSKQKVSTAGFPTPKPFG